MQRRDQEKSRQQTRFWDTLSRVRLSKRALEEFDRRRRRVARQRPREHVGLGCEAFIFRDVKQVARRGGPSLAHLRGYADSPTTHQSSSRRRKRPAASGSSDSSNPLKSSLYTPNFEQKLIDSGISPYLFDGHEEPTNNDKILACLTATRISLSPSRFTEQDFKHFQDKADTFETGTDALQIAFSIIEGRGHGHQHAADLMFTRTKPLAEGLTQAKPDRYDGTAAERIDLRVRDALQELIVPSDNSHAPAAPNFFTEVRSAASRTSPMKRQACHDGAIGARAMHALQNYGEDIPTYDGKAYSFSNTYHFGTLQLCAHHLTTPAQPGSDPKYHMTQLGAFAMTGNSKTFREGATAYRNLRDYAEEQRDCFIHQANERAPNIPASTSSHRLTSTRSVRIASCAEEPDTSPDDSSLIDDLRQH